LPAGVTDSTTSKRRLGFRQDVAHVTQIGAGAAGFLLDLVRCNEARRQAALRGRGTDAEFDVVRGHDRVARMRRHVHRPRRAIERRHPCADRAAREPFATGCCVPLDEHDHDFSIACFLRDRGAGLQVENIEADVFPAGARRRDMDDLAVFGMLRRFDEQVAHIFLQLFRATTLKTRRSLRLPEWP
jgi:hypothetical protein